MPNGDQTKNEEYILNASAAIILTLDRNGTVTMINDRGAKMLGYPREEIVGKDWIYNFVPARFREELNRVRHGLMKEDTLPEHEYHENPILTVNGERTIGWSNSYMKNEKGEIIGTISSGLDVTDRK